MNESVDIVNVYGPHTCGTCMGVMKYLIHNLGEDKVQKIDIDDKPELIDKFSNEGFMSFPVIEYNGKLHQGNKLGMTEVISEINK